MCSRGGARDETESEDGESANDSGGGGLAALLIPASPTEAAAERMLWTVREGRGGVRWGRRRAWWVRANNRGLAQGEAAGSGWRGMAPTWCCSNAAHSVFLLGRPVFFFFLHCCLSAWRYERPWALPRANTFLTHSRRQPVGGKSLPQDATLRWGLSEGIPCRITRYPRLPSTRHIVLVTHSLGVRETAGQLPRHLRRTVLSLSLPAGGDGDGTNSSGTAPCGGRFSSSHDH